MSEETPIKQASWTGSEDERRPQGICLPPKKAARKIPLYLVRAGTNCAIRRVDGWTWRAHTTVKDVGFEKYEHYEPGFYEFRTEGWLMKVQADRVIKRK